MPRGRPLLCLTLDDDQREQLQPVARSTSLPHGLVLRQRLAGKLSAANYMIDTDPSPFE